MKLRQSQDFQAIVLMTYLATAAKIDLPICQGRLVIEIHDGTQYYEAPCCATLDGVGAKFHAARKLYALGSAARI